jgi:hypothetical protein
MVRGEPITVWAKQLHFRSELFYFHGSFSNDVAEDPITPGKFIIVQTIREKATTYEHGVLFVMQDDGTDLSVLKFQTFDTN